MRKLVLGALAAVALAGAAAMPARAQLIPDTFGVGDYFNGLTKEDFELMEKSSASLYQNPDAKVGLSQSWKNPKTRNRGQVTLVKQFEYKGMPCWRLRHSFKVKTTVGTRTLEASRCKTADGTWKLL